MDSSALLRMVLSKIPNLKKKSNQEYVGSCPSGTHTDKNQASKYIGCCKRTIERAVEQGVLKSSGDNFGKKMFRQTWLDNWLESKRS